MTRENKSFSEEVFLSLEFQVFRYQRLSYQEIPVFRYRCLSYQEILVFQKQESQE